MSGIDEWTNEVHQGDAVETMNRMPEKSVDLVMFSPPYWGLRNYGEEGQIGLEETPQGYVKTMMEVGEAVKRILKDSGSLWLNLGDTYAGGGGIAGVPDGWNSLSTNNREKYPESVPARDVDYPDKCKLLIPHRVAISFIDNYDWICRNDVIWKKLNGMPESVVDRFTKTFEYFFFFTKDQDYYFDMEAVKNDGAQPRDVFETTVANLPEAHFAAFPHDLIEPPIQATCPEDGVVLDPFIGSGTTAVVAEQLDRNWIGIDLNKEYVDMSYDRIEGETKKIFDDRSLFNY